MPTLAVPGLRMILPFVVLRLILPAVVGVKSVRSPDAPPSRIDCEFAKVIPFVEPLTAMSPPETVSFDDGFVIPMPTLPALETTSALEPMFATLEKRFVEEAVVEKRFVVVAFVVVERLKVAMPTVALVAEKFVELAVVEKKFVVVAEVPVARVKMRLEMV